MPDSFDSLFIEFQDSIDSNNNPHKKFSDIIRLAIKQGGISTLNKETTSILTDSFYTYFKKYLLQMIRDKSISEKINNAFLLIPVFTALPAKIFPYVESLIHPTIIFPFIKKSGIYENIAYSVKYTKSPNPKDKELFLTIAFKYKKTNFTAELVFSFETEFTKTKGFNLKYNIINISISSDSHYEKINISENNYYEDENSIVTLEDFKEISLLSIKDKKLLEKLRKLSNNFFEDFFDIIYPSLDGTLPEE